MDNLSLRYHPDSPYYGKEGYLGSLTTQQSNCLEVIETWVIEQSFEFSDLCLNSLNPKLTLLRYLRANKFSIEKTKAHILRNLEWRTEMDVKGICSKTPEEILGCSLQDIMNIFPHWQSGTDEYGRPIIYKQYGSMFDATKIFQLTTKDAIAKYHIWEQEACMRLCYENSIRTGCIVETLTCVIDIGGLNISQVTRDFLALIKLIADIDQSQYPETLGRTFILNASSLFPMVWRMIKPWLDPVVAGKIQILAGVDQWHPYLLEHIGLDYLSSSYGGNSEYLDMSLHPYAMIVYDEDEDGPEKYSKDMYGSIGTITRRMLIEEGIRKEKQTQKRKERFRFSKQSSFNETKNEQLELNYNELNHPNNEVKSNDFVHDIESGGINDFINHNNNNNNNNHNNVQNYNTLKYNINSPYYDREGYLGCLTEQQAIALETVQQWVIDEKVDLSNLALNSLHPRLTLLRYLRATKFSVEKAIEKIKENIEWRLEMNVKEIINKRPHELLGCEMSELVKVFPHWQSGYDKCGRPVLYKQYNNSFDATKILQMSSNEAITKYHIWEQEACMRLCYENSKKSGDIVETLTCVIDVKGMQLYQITRDFLAIVKAIADIDQNHYPETLGQTFIINTPSVFPFVWRGVKPWLDPVVVSKIQIFGQNESEWLEALDKNIGKCHMPKTYGGDLASLDPNLHPYESILGTFPSGSDGKGLSIGDRMKMIDNNSQQNSHQNHRSISSPHTKRNASSEDSSVCTSDFGDAIDGFSNDDNIDNNNIDNNNKIEEYIGWDNEIQFLRSMVHEINAEECSDTGFDDCVEDEPKYTDPIYDDIRKFLEASPLYYIYTRLKQFRTSLIGCYKMLLPKFLLKLSKNRLSRYLNYSVLTSVIICLCCIGLSGYALSNMYWSSSSQAVRFQMWSGIVVLCLSSIFGLLNFAGFVGNKTNNRPLLILFNCSLSAFFIVFLIIAVICFIFSSNNSNITGIRNEALNQVDRGKNVSTLLQAYNLTLGTLCSVLSFFSLIPLMLSTCYCELLDRELRMDEINKLNRYSIERRLNEQIQQLRVVVRIAQFVAIMIALPMIGYGASALHYLLRIRFDYSLFAVYCLLYSGITTLLSSSVGIWSSFTSSVTFLRFYLYFVMPVHFLVLLGTGIENCYLFPRVLVQFNNEYEKLHITEDNKDRVSFLLQIELLVGGVLSLSAAVFQIVCLFCIVSYYLRIQQLDIITQKRYQERLSLYQQLNINGKVIDEKLLSDITQKKPITRRDRLIIIWSIVVGLLHIYVGGTYAMFAYRIVENDNSWMVTIWEHLGKYDNRYIRADGFLVSTQGLFALVGGPLLLIYAWAIATNNSRRQVLGIIVNCLEVYTEVLYFALEIQSGFANINLSNPTILTIGFFANDIIRLIIPPLIISHEVNTVVKNNQKKSMLTDDDEYEYKFGSSDNDEYCSISSSVMKESKGSKDGVCYLQSRKTLPSPPPASLVTGSLSWGRYLSMRQRKNN